MSTENIDKLFLELSQFTKAKTEREGQLERILKGVLDAWEKEANWGDGIHENHKYIYNRARNKIKETK